MQPDALQQTSIAIKNINILKVGRRLIEFSKEQIKKNPNSLRFIIGHIVNFYFDGDRKHAAERMEKCCKIYRSERPDRPAKTMNSKALSDILNDKKHAEYWHIEAISSGIGMPSGALLALSRVYSLVRDGNQEAARAFISGLRSFADDLEAFARTEILAKENLDGMIKRFEETYQLERSASPAGLGLGLITNS